MSADFFIDTNALVYWRDASDPAKQKQAATWMQWLLDHDRGILSSQALQEHLAAASMAHCKWILSEDMQSGQRIDSVLVVNPFESSPEDLV